MKAKAFHTLFQYIYTVKKLKRITYDGNTSNTINRRSGLFIAKDIEWGNFR